MRTNNVYGIHVDFTQDMPQWEAFLKDAQPYGESLAAKVIIAGRIIRIDWNGRIDVEPAQ